MKYCTEYCRYLKSWVVAPHILVCVIELMSDEMPHQRLPVMNPPDCIQVVLLGGIRTKNGLEMGYEYPLLSHFK